MTLDTYRISAVEQLRTYAEILNCPIEVAYDKDDVSEAVNRLESLEIQYLLILQEEVIETKFI